MFENDDHGLNWSIGSTDGYTAIAEIGWTPEFFKKPINATDQDRKKTVSIAGKGLPGHYSLGFTYSQWDFYPRFLGGFEDHSYGFYAHADQMIFQEEPGSDNGLVVFVASGYYPQTEISIVPFPGQCRLELQRSHSSTATTIARCCISFMAISAMTTRAVSACPAVTKRNQKKCWSSRIDFNLHPGVISNPIFNMLSIRAGRATFPMQS